ncbi:MAG: three-Cys-motif partner protein TcmP [Blastocatellia bacterium]|nr:three-Cys-motif partner protein TcmP [Blastocatellia bacterium]
MCLRRSFGFSGIPFSLLERLLRKKRCEVFVTFMADAINRFLEHPDDKVVKHIVEAFGGNDAIAIANGGGDRVGNLRKLYQSKLKSVAKYVRYFEMRDRVDRTQYYLILTSNSAVGHVKMKEAMWRVDPAGEFSFSDATNPDQFVLFDDDPTGNLASQIRPRLGVGRKVTCLQVREFVENDTAYLKKHMIAVLKRDEEQGLLQVDAVKSNGRRRIAGTFPDEVTLQWL